VRRYFVDRIKFHKPKRDIHTVFIHCSANDNPEFDNIRTIRNWHLEQGFSDVGYHYFIQKSGFIQPGRGLEEIPAAQRGHNTGSIAICLHGLKEEYFTQEQFWSLRYLCISMQRDYDQRLLFKGHCEVSPKSCPVFDYKKVLTLDLKHQMTRERILLRDFRFNGLEGIDIANTVLEVYK
jgi:hypothetical protein